MSQVLHQIWERSSCLTKAQLMSYAQGRLIEEEVYAVETHLNSCPLCSAAIDGVLHHGLAAVEAIAEMDGSFLKKHFEDTRPRIHLNSVAPAVSHHSRKKRETPIQFPIRAVAGLTATGLAVLGIFWLLNRITFTPPEQPATITPAAATMEKEPPVILQQHEKPQTQPAAATGEELPEQAAMVLPVATSPVATPAAEPEKTAAVQPEMPVQPTAQEEKNAVPPGNTPETSPIVPAVPDTEKNAAPKKEPKAEEPAPAKQNPEAVPLSGSSVSEQQQFRYTIESYKKDLNNPDIEKRNLARLVSAEAYQGLGQRVKAIELLEQIMSEGGPHKGEARRALRKLRREQQ